MLTGQRHPGWLSLEEAAHAVHISLPALRYLARRLALPLGISLDERGDAYLPAGKLELLRQVAAYRSQGYSVDQIENLLQEGALDPAGDLPMAHADLERAQGRPGPAPAPKAASQPAGSPPEDRSLPFPFPQDLAQPVRREDQPQAGRRGDADALESLRADVEALYRENRELRQRLEALLLWIQEREMLLETERTKSSGEIASSAWEHAHATRQEAVHAMAAGETAGSEEGAQLTRTPSGHRRHAVVRQWRPPVLNGRRQSHPTL